MTLVLWIVAIWVGLLALAVLSVSRFTSHVRAKQRRADVASRTPKAQKGIYQKRIGGKQDPPAA